MDLQRVRRRERDRRREPVAVRAAPGVRVVRGVPFAQIFCEVEDGVGAEQEN